MITKSPEKVLCSIAKSAIPLFFLFFAAKLSAQTYNAEVLNYESYYTVDKDVLNESCFVAIKINNAQGDKYAVIGIPYSKENPVNDIEAWIEDMNGKKIRKLKDNEIADNSNMHSFSLYEDNYIKLFELKYNAYPYIIKYNYTRKEKEFIGICDWAPFYSEIPTHEAKLVIAAPAGYGISYNCSKITPPVKDSVKNKIKLTWETKYEQIIKPEVCSPSLREFMPHVLAVPINFNYGIGGSQQSWASLGNWSYRLNKGLDDLPESEVQKVNEITKGISNKKVIVKKLYEYLQDNTRYESVQIGIGGVKSFPATYVVSKRYGDCKALSNYMKALLKAAGITSYTALVYAGRDGDTPKITGTFVSPEFNHVILMVPMEKDTIWLDCTAKTNPAGYLGTFTQDRYALVIDENNSKLVKIPAMTPSDCYTFCYNDISIDANRNALLKSSTTSKGYGFELNASYSAELNKDKQKEYLSEIIPYRNFEVKQLEIKTECRDSAAIKMDYQLILKNNVTQSGNYMFLQLSGPKLPEFENPSKRHLPICIAYPVNYKDSTEVSVPDKYKIQKNADKSFETKYGSVQIKYALTDNKIEICRYFLLKSGEYTTEEYPDFYQFITKVHTAINTPLSFIRNE